MPSTKHKPKKVKKEKNKLIKLIEISETEDNDSEHELSYYMNDRVKLMKEVLKIIKPKKIKAMAPDCIKHLDIEEINSMLLEELLGISNKRLKYIFNGQNLDEDSSSTDPEEEKQPIDIISLDDVSEDDFVIDVDAEKPKKHKRHKIKQESKTRKIKKGKTSNKPAEKPKIQEENLMSVLELLELQARARAIRSQLVLESNRKLQETTANASNESLQLESDTDDAIIIESPKNDEIIIMSSDSEMEIAEDSDKNGHKLNNKADNDEKNNTNKESCVKKKKIALIRDRFIQQKSNEIIEELCENVAGNKSLSNETDKIAEHDNAKESNKNDVENANSIEKSIQDQSNANNDVVDSIIASNDKNSYDDAIVINVDQEDMDGIDK